MKRQHLIQRINEIKPPRALLINLLADAMLVINSHEKARKKAGKDRWANEPRHIAYRAIEKNWLILKKRHYFDVRGNKSRFISDMKEIYDTLELELDGEYLKKLMAQWELEFEYRELASSILQIYSS